MRLTTTRALDEHAHYLGVLTDPASTADAREVAAARLRELVQAIGHNGSHPGARHRWNHVPLVDLIRETVPLTDAKDGICRGGHTNKHESKTGTSLLVWAAEGTWHCLSCKKGGGPVEWVMDRDGCAPEAAIRLLIERYGPPLDEDEPAPPFPLETLPPAIRAYVEIGARGLVAPPDFVAVPLLVEAGAAIGNAAVIELKPHWCEGANLNAGIVGDPGAKKTPAQTLAARPIHRIQQRLAVGFGEKLAKYKKDLAAWESAPKGERGQRPDLPTFPHLFTSDATSEALATMLASSKGIVLLKDELTSWVRAMDQYKAGGRGSDRQFFLSAWSRSPIKVDRKSNPVPILVPHPHLSVVGGIQPDLLPDLADAAQREDGFLDRLLWSFQEKVADHWTEEGLDLETMATVEGIFEKLYELSPIVGEGEDEPTVVRLSPAARTGWAEWYREHAAEVEVEGFNRRLVGPWAKMPAQLARLTLILHALSDPGLETPVSAETLGAACDLVDYFKAHARRAYRRLGQQRRARIVVLLQALKERGALTQSEAMHDVFKRNVSAEWVHAAFEELAEAGIVVKETRQKDTGRPATLWRLA